MSSAATKYSYDYRKPQPFSVPTGTSRGVTLPLETVPIILVPGLMGTRLQRQGKKLWDPDDQIFMLWKYGTLLDSPASKKKALVGPGDFDLHHLDIFEEDAGTADGYDDFPYALERGWWSVSADTYGRLLRGLEHRQWPSEIAETLRTPVYVFGYSWTAPTAVNGKRLKKRIEEVVAAHQKNGESCQQVILVTHSMGGLVTRAALLLPGTSDKVLGVVHGVQPALGAPAAYWQMKAGVARSASLRSIPAAWVLGTNGAEVTAMLAFMPGVLELLPAPTYVDNSGSAQWVSFRHGDFQTYRALPESSAAEELYKVPIGTADAEDQCRREYWRLIKKQYLQPEEQPRRPLGRVVQKYNKRIEKVVAAQKRLLGHFHPQTLSFFGSGNANPTTDHIAFVLRPHDWRAIVRENTPDAETAVLDFALFGPESAAVHVAFAAFKRTEIWQSRGAFKITIRADDGREMTVDLMHPAELRRLNGDERRSSFGAGDGTVPESSARQPPNAATGFPGIEHSKAYCSDLPLGFTTEAVIRLLRGKFKQTCQ